MLVPLYLCVTYTRGMFIHMVLMSFLDGRPVVVLQSWDSFGNFMSQSPWHGFWSVPSFYSHLNYVIQPVVMPRWVVCWFNYRGEGTGHPLWRHTFDLRMAFICYIAMPWPRILNMRLGEWWPSGRQVYHGTAFYLRPDDQQDGGWNLVDILDNTGIIWL